MSENSLPLFPDQDSESPSDPPEDRGSIAPYPVKKKYSYPPGETPVGTRFLRLVTTAPPYRKLFSDRKRPRPQWMVDCLCDCGSLLTTQVNSLRSGFTLSCGCYRGEQVSKAVSKHGQIKTRLYSIWEGMKARCGNPNFTGFALYGGRGILVCVEWRENYMAFHDWAHTNGYEQCLTLDRINVNGNYEPANCTWATMREQANNTRRTLHITAFGETKLLAEWVKDPRISAKYHQIAYRLRHGWPEELALTALPNTYARKQNQSVEVHKPKYVRKRLFHVWSGMKSRCYNQNSMGFARWGGRGISVCDEWRDSSECFYSWAYANGYEQGLTLERIDVNGNYEPSNCRWASWKDQARNTSRNHYVTAFGETKIIDDWLSDPRTVVGRGTLSKRLKSGWPDELALTAPPRSQYRRKT